MSDKNRLGSNSKVFVKQFISAVASSHVSSSQEPRKSYSLVK